MPMTKANRSDLPGKAVSGASGCFNRRWAGEAVCGSVGRGPLNESAQTTRKQATRRDGFSTCILPSTEEAKVSAVTDENRKSSAVNAAVGPNKSPVNRA